MPRLLIGLSLVIPLFSVTAGCSDGVCSDPNGALAGAAEGEVVSAGACTITSDVTIPAGVVFQGDGPGTVLVGRVTLGPGASLTDVAIESVGPHVVAVYAGGASTDAPVTLQNVTLRVERGVGIHVEGIGATLANVSLTGPITATNAADIAPMPTSDVTATHGLLLVDAGSAESPVQLIDVTTTGFARFGALFRNSHVTWNGGGASGNLTVGAMAERGSLDLAGISLDSTYQGIQPFPAYGGVFTGGVEVSTTDVTVDGNEGYGLLHDDATAGHVDLVANDNGDAAIWVQSARSFMLAGEGSALSGNLLAGVVLVASPNAMIQDATIDTSALATRVDGTVGDIQVGDGVHVVMDSVAGLVIDGLSMTGNERAGMLLDVADGSVDGAVMDVTVDGTGEALGVIAQGPSGLIPSGDWDLGITRLGATAANDAELDAALDIVGLIGPMFVPPPSM